MKTIGVVGLNQNFGFESSIIKLSEIFNFNVIDFSDSHIEDIDALIITNLNRYNLKKYIDYQLPFLAYLNENSGNDICKSDRLTFTANNCLPTFLHKMPMELGSDIGIKFLPNWVNELATPILNLSGLPIWSNINQDGYDFHFASTPIPSLVSEVPLFQIFNGKDFISMLPLILFLKRFLKEPDWESSNLHACFMFDDPNLHWSSYGFINYKEIIKTARQHNFHTSFAMVPLDTYFSHRPTVSLFKDNKDFLSLVMHGNNHTYKELAQDNSDEYRRLLFTQALRRVYNFEKSTGLEVAKVMVPPHGACNEKSINSMRLLGYEGSCISKGSLQHFNKDAGWISTIGFEPTMNIHGFTNLYRFPLSKYCKNEIIISAILDQPLIIRAHHQDLSNGIDILTEISTFINYFFSVEWSCIQNIFRNQFQMKLAGETLHIKLLSNRINFVVPKGVNFVHISNALSYKLLPNRFLFRINEFPMQWQVYVPESPIIVNSDQIIDIKSEILDKNSPPDIINSKYYLWPIIRRTLTEVRDRLTPIKTIF